MLGAIPGTPLFAKVSHVLDGEFFLYLFSSIYKNFKGNFKLSLKLKKKKVKKKKIPGPKTRSPEKVSNGELRFQKRVGNVWSARGALPRARAPDTAGRWPRPGAHGPDSLSAPGHRSRGSSVSPRAPGQRASGSRPKLRPPPSPTLPRAQFLERRGAPAGFPRCAWEADGFRT